MIHNEVSGLNSNFNKCHWLRFDCVRGTAKLSKASSKRLFSMSRMKKDNLLKYSCNGRPQENMSLALK